MSLPVRFLFVDDELPILSVLERALKGEGFAMHFTADPQQALALISEHDIEVVVCDHMMPTMKGVELLTRVSEGHAHVVRILASGSPDRSGIDERAVDRFVEKPWSLYELKALLHEVEAEVLARRAGQR